MAKITAENSSIEVADGAMLWQSCEELGVPFGCRSGNCGTCRIKVLQGMENLGSRNEQEEKMFLEADERLACQCRIKQGEIKIKF
ncbi:MAG TPA: 2Fe-2S iron-sulfur cluster-binding protein [Candidatus Nanoarchaeia archaeon]|nr:2Fe-2S iron-sulfur cluster-binding protein [Candidatus Nanoarchaeia archaeon]